MKKRHWLLSRVLVVLMLVVSTVGSGSDQNWFGGPEDVEFAAQLWMSLEQSALVGPQAELIGPRVGVHPHGALLESTTDTVTVNGQNHRVAIKFAYHGRGATIESITRDRNAYLEDITVMLKREEGYDDSNQNWFYAKYFADGSLDTTPNGIKLAGRIAKGKDKGCIACHRKAGDYLFAF